MARLLVPPVPLVPIFQLSFLFIPPYTSNVPTITVGVSETTANSQTGGVRMEYGGIEKRRASGVRTEGRTENERTRARQTRTRLTRDSPTMTGTAETTETRRSGPSRSLSRARDVHRVRSRSECRTKRVRRCDAAGGHRRDRRRRSLRRSCACVTSAYSWLDFSITREACANVVTYLIIMSRKFTRVAVIVPMCLTNILQSVSDWTLLRRNRAWNNLVK